MGKDDKLQEFLTKSVDTQLHIQTVDNGFESIDLVKDTFLADWQKAEQTYTGRLFDVEEYRQMARIQNGPEEKLGKFQTKSGWLKKNKKKLEEIRKRKAAEREAFGSYSGKLQTDFDQKLRYAGVNYVQHPMLYINASLNGICTDIYKDEKKLDLFDFSKVKDLKEEDRNGLSELNDMFKKLTMAQQLGEAASIDLIEKYRALVENDFIKPEDMSTSAKEICEYLAQKNPNQCHIVLLDTIATSLYNKLNSIAARQPKGFVRYENFKTFYGVKNLINHAALKALASKDRVDYVAMQERDKQTYVHLQEWKDTWAREQREKDEKEARENLVKKRLSVIEEGVKDHIGAKAEDGKLKLGEKNEQADWYIKGELVDIVKQYFLSKYNDEIGSPNDDDFYREITRINRNIKTNQILVRELIKAQADDMTFGLQDLQKEIEELVLGNLKDQMLFEHNEKGEKEEDVTRESFEKRITESIQSNAEHFTKHMERVEQIQKTFPEISKENIRTILQEYKTKYLSLKEEDFQAALMNDVFNYKVSLSIIKEKVSGLVSTYNEKEMEKYLTEKLGDVLLTGSPALVGMLAEHTIKNLRYQGGNYNLARSEKMFIDACKELPREYWGPIGRRMRSLMDQSKMGERSAEQEKNMFDRFFKDVKTSVEGNEAAFEDLLKDRALPRFIWKKLFLAKTEQITNTKESFTAAIEKLVENIPDNAARFTMKEYLKGEKEQTAPAEQTKEGYYVGRLKGDDFLESPIFDGFLSESDKNMIYETLRTVLCDEHCALKTIEGMEFLKDITTLEQLDNLQERDFLTLVGHLKINLAAGIERWSGYQGAYKDEIKRELMQKILVGRVEETEIDQVIKRVVTARSEQVEAARKRLDLAFLGEVPKHGKVNYVYLDVKAQQDYKLFQSHAYKPATRHKKFAYSNIAWDSIRQQQEEKEAELYLRRLWDRAQEECQKESEKKKKSFSREDIMSRMSQMYKKDRDLAKAHEEELAEINANIEQLNENARKEIEKNPQKEQKIKTDLDKKLDSLENQRTVVVKKQMEFVKQVNVSTKTVYAIQKAFDLVDEQKNHPGRSTYFNEFLLEGYEDALFSHGSVGEEAFLLYEDEGNQKNNGYNGFIADHIQMIRDRNNTLDTMLHTLESILTKEQLEEIKQRMRYFLVNMEGSVLSESDMTQEQKRNNLEKFGYETFSLMCLDMVNRIREGSLTLGGQTEAEKELADKKQVLLDYADGLYAPVADLLMKQNEFLNFMVKYDRNSFIGYLDELKKTVGVAMEGLRSFGGQARLDSIVKQFIMSNENMILSNKEFNQSLTKEDWSKKFHQYLNTFNEASVAGRNSINTRISQMAVGKISAFLAQVLALDKGSSEYETRAKLDTIITLSGGDLSVLFTSEKMNQLLNELETHINANMKEFETWQKNRSVDVTPVIDEKTGNKRYTAQQRFEIELRQYVQIKASTMYKEAFQANIDKFEEEFRSQYEKKKSPEPDYKHLDDLAKARLTIETQKQKGRDADKKFDEKMSELRTIRYSSSPLVAVYGGRKKNKNIEEDSIKKRQKKLEKLKDKLLEEDKLQVDPYVVSILGERQLAVEALDDDLAIEHLRMLNEAYTLLKQDQTLSDKEAKKRLVHFYAGYKNAAGVESYKGISISSKLEDLNRVYKDKEDLLYQFRYQIGELKLDVSLENEYRDFLEALAVALYTEEENTFKKLIAERLCYFKSASLVHAEVEDWFAKEENAKKFSGEEATRLRMGLRDYFHAQVLNGGKELTQPQLEDIKKEMEELLADEDKRRFLYESKSDFGRVGSDDLKESERTASKTETRHDVQNFILSQKKGFVDKLLLRTNNPMVKAYANLDEDQKKLFALALSLPVGMLAGESLESVKLFSDEKKDRDLTDELLSHVEKYLEDEEFDPQLDYGKILHRIQKLDGKLNEDMFNMALKFTQTIIAKKNSMQPKDFKLLGEGRKAIAVAEIFKEGAEGQKEMLEEALQKCDSEKSFKAQITALAQKDKNISNDFLRKVENVREDKKAFFSDYEEKLAERVTSLEEADLRKLIIILQNRSAIDFTTSVSLTDEIAVKETGYANPVLRELLKDQLTEINNPKLFDQLKEKGMGKAEFENALVNLFSYQLRDDITIHPDEIQKSDFARNALGRKTHIDWRLLSGALKLLDEINYESKRFYACRMARENVENSYNEAAKKKYEELNLKSKEIESFKKFDEIIMKCSKESTKDEENKNIASYVAGFQALSADGKILFIKALQNRDILDISRKNLYTGIFGKGERDYVNPKGRDDLIDEFLEKSTGERTALRNTTEEFTNAMKSLLSTQIDDTRNFDKVEDYQKLEAGGTIIERVEYETRRNTAIDWKLFGRALAFVHRTLDERQMRLGDEELYRSMGEIEENGNFQFDGKLLRKNIHNSGNRYTHVLGRIAINVAKEFIPGASYINYALGVILSKEEKNAVAKYNYLAEEEEEAEEATGFMKYKGYVETGNDYLDQAASNDMVAEKLKEKLGTDQVTGITKIVSRSVYGASRTIDAGKAVLDDVKAEEKLKGIYAKAEKKEKEDKERLKKASAEETALERERMNEAFAKNRFIMKHVAKSLVSGTADQQLVDDLAEVFDTVLSGDVLKKTLLGDNYEEKDELQEEAEKFDTADFIIQQSLFAVRAIMQALKEKDMMRDFFYDLKGEAALFAKEVMERKTKVTGDKSKLTSTQKNIVKDMENIEFDQKSNGFEGFDEHAEFVALKVVYTILFAASNQNPIASDRVRGVGILVVLGMKEDVGKRDYDTCMKLYSKLMGAELR